MENLTFGEQVKIILSRKKMTIKELAGMIEERTGMKMSRQNLTQRLGRDNFQEQDMRMIANILECPFRLSILSEEMEEEAQIPTYQKEKVMRIAESEQRGDITSETDEALEAEIARRMAEMEKRREQAARENTEAQESAKLPQIEIEEVSLEEAEELEADELVTEELEAEELEAEELEEEELSLEEAMELEEEELEDTRMSEPDKIRSNEPAEERDMTIGEIYGIHQGLEKLEKTIKDDSKEAQFEPEKVKETIKKVESTVEKKAKTPSDDDFQPVLSYDDEDEDLEKGEMNPYTGREYQTNSVRMHPSRIGYVQVYDRSEHKWTDMTEWAFLGYQERKKVLLGKDYEPPIYLD